MFQITLAQRTRIAAPKIEKKLAKNEALPFTGTDFAAKKIPYTFSTPRRRNRPTANCARSGIGSWSIS